MSISCTTASIVGGLDSVHVGQALELVGVDVGLALRRHVQLVDVGRQPVAATDVRDRFIGGVGDHAFAEAVRRFGDAALPPGERRFAFVAGQLQVRSDDFRG